MLKRDKPVPRISVVMPVYNAEATLEQAIASLAGQTEGDFECLLLDDGSHGRGSFIERVNFEGANCIRVLCPGQIGQKFRRNCAIIQSSCGSPIRYSGPDLVGK